jgi:NADH-quinone oxidoreductase subunit F
MICDVSADGLAPLDDAGLDGGTACPVDEAMRQMQRAAASSCGRDVFCREGTRQVQTILADLTTGKGESADLELIDELCSLIAANASCGMAATSALRTLDLLRGRTEEWELHLRRKRCTSLTCEMSYTIYIAPDDCNGCGECLPLCPEAAITGSEGLIHVVVTDSCTKCLACLPVCPTTAVRKAGPIKPRVPVSPVPVGSFTADDAGGGMTRRRRRSR